jgi:hypothetical protein
MISRKENASEREARETRDKVFPQRAVAGSEAMTAYRAEEQAIRDRTARLRSERLAWEAAAPTLPQSKRRVTRISGRK